MNSSILSWPSVNYGLEHTHLSWGCHQEVPMSILLFMELAATVIECILSPLLHTLLAGAIGGTERGLAVTHLLSYWPRGGSEEEWLPYRAAFLVVFSWKVCVCSQSQLFLNTVLLFRNGRLAHKLHAQLRTLRSLWLLPPFSHSNRKAYDIILWPSLNSKEQASLKSIPQESLKNITQLCKLEICGFYRCNLGGGIRI